MARAPVGQRIRKRRQMLAYSQCDVAARVGISPSYLNLIEHNKRPIGGALLNRIAAAISLDSNALAGTEEARLIAELSEVAAEASQIGIDLRAEDARDVVANNPKAARAILGLYRAYREARERSDFLGERLGEDSFLAEASQQVLALITTIRSYAEILKDYGDLSDNERQQFIGTLVAESEALTTRASDMFDFMGGHGARRPRAAPREVIEDFISDRANYFPLLEDAAEEFVAGLSPQAPTLETLADMLDRRHGIRVVPSPARSVQPHGERLHGAQFLISDLLARTSMRFRLARLIGSLEYGELLDDLVDGATLASADIAARLRRALSSYFAGAVLMPYARFHDKANELRLDIGRLSTSFDASFEQVCHRLTTLRRPGAEGVPLHLLRTDIAGNITKRFSASGLRLPRYGGACPRWIVHHAFASPGRIITQVGQLPDGETFFFVTRATLPSAGNPETEQQHAVMIGCALEHAHRLVYADGLDLSAPRAVPIGITCRQCARDACAHRVFDRLPVPEIPAAATPVPVT